MTGVFDLTRPKTYAAQLLRQAEYRILGPDGAVSSGGSIDLFNLSPTHRSEDTRSFSPQQSPFAPSPPRRQAWGRSTLKSDSFQSATARTSLNSAWTAGEVGHAVIHLNASNPVAERLFVELPQELVATRPEGTSVHIFKTPQPDASGQGPTAQPTLFLQDAKNPHSFETLSIQQDINSIGFFAGETVRDPNDLLNGVERFGFSRITLEPDRWMLVGYEWGRAGKRIFLNGSAVWANENRRSGTNNLNNGPLRIGKMVQPTIGTYYKNIAIAFYAFWPRQLGEPAHRALQMARLPGEEA